MAAASAARHTRHETRALLRAHLAAASRYGHATRHCPVCHRLLRLVMELPDDEPDRGPGRGPGREPEGGAGGGGGGDQGPTSP